MDTRSPQREQDALSEGLRAGALGTPAGQNPHTLGTPEYTEWERGRRSVEARHAAAALQKRARTCRYRVAECDCGGRGLCLDVA